MSRVEEYLSQIMKRETEKDKKRHMIICIVGVVLFIAAVAGIVYAVYRFMKPEYLEDYEDDFDDEFDYDDDFFDDDDEFDFDDFEEDDEADMDVDIKADAEPKKDPEEKEDSEEKKAVEPEKDADKE